MDQGTAGRYRTIPVLVGRYVPPPPEEVSSLMLNCWRGWNKDAARLSPVLSSAIVHYRFEAIHPFADGNGRTGRALALWELYRRGFDTTIFFSVDEFYWEDRPRYYAALDAVRREGEDLTGWLEYAAEGLQRTLERVWTRVQKFSAGATRTKLVFRPKQEQLLQLLRDHKSMTPQKFGMRSYDEAGCDEVDATIVGRRFGAARRHTKKQVVHPGLMNSMLAMKPILSIASAGEELKLSVPTVTASLKHLAKLGIARETNGHNYGQPSSIFMLEMTTFLKSEQNDIR